MAAVERGLFPNNVEAAKYKNAELYTMIKKYDKQHGVDTNPVIQQSVQEQEKAEQKIAEQPKAEVEKADEKKADSTTPNKGNNKKPRRLPSKESKQKAKPEQNGVVKNNSESVVEATDNVHQEHTMKQQTVDSAKSSTKKDEKQKVELINYDNPKPFRTLLLSLLRKQFGVNYSSLKNSGLTKKNYTKAIEYLNESIDVARLVLGSMVETDVLVHMVGKDGKVTDDKVYIHRDMIAEEIANLESDESAIVVSEPEAKNDKSVETADSDGGVKEESVVYEQSDEEKEIADTIVATFDMLKVELDTIRKENEELKKENLKLQAKISNNQRHDVDVHDSLVDFMNKLANTKDEHYVWVWKEINKIVSAKLPVATDKSPVVLDIEKLIIEESVRLHNEAEAKRELEEKKARALEEDTMYEGTNISYIDGDVAKPDGVKKKIFNVYKEWYDDCKMWVEYVVDRMAEIDSIGATKKRKSAISNLESELDDWYGEWYDSDCDEDTVDMVVEVMGDLIHSKHRNPDKALSNLVAIIDELELV